GYLLGTIPFADLAARAATEGTVDLRTVGSGNPGATNASAVLGKRWGAAVLAADVAKAAGACMVGRAIAGDLGAHVGGTASVVGRPAAELLGSPADRGVDDHDGMQQRGDPREVRRVANPGRLAARSLVRHRTDTARRQAGTRAIRRPGPRSRQVRSA